MQNSNTSIVFMVIQESSKLASCKVKSLVLEYLFAYSFLFFPPFLFYICLILDY